MANDSDPIPPFFDPAALRQELTELFRSSGGPEAARPKVLARLRELDKSARGDVRKLLDRTASGLLCAEGLAKFYDELVRLIYDFTIAHVYHRTTSGNEDEKIAIAATGGYGRGLLAPSSDIDLLFVLPYRQTPWCESVTEYMLYMLWDLRLKVGHATRTTNQCVTLAKSDITIRTSLLDARLILGDGELFREFQTKFQNEVIQGSAREFIQAKMSERDSRHKQSGESRYKVEPNVKDGKGGLRDLHTLHWLSKYVSGHSLGHDASAVGDDGEVSREFEPDEIATFKRCEEFLWTVRCHLHFAAGRAEEVLSFDLQPTIAEKLDYQERGGLRTVERFMKHYFLVAKDVGELTAVLCSSLEMQQLAAAPRINELLNPLTWATRRRVRRVTDFRIDNGRLNIASLDVFHRDPVNFLRIFAEAEASGTFLHPNALRVIRRAQRLIDDALRNGQEANQTFIKLLTEAKSPEATLRWMNETGVLGRFIPEFGQVVSMMQFNMYHHYTVDEHLIRTVGQLTAIENGELTETLPLSSRIIKSIHSRRVLFVAAFLHDIGKGRIEDHSTVGADIAQTLCPRFGLDKGETDTVVWLVREHLTMSNVSQSRDLADPKTIRDFANVVQTRERLNLLLLLTVADIRAVGPGTWNGWKGQLLRQLYHETELLVAGGHSTESRSVREQASKDAFIAALDDWDSDDVQSFIDIQYSDYWLRTDTTRQVEHAKLLRTATAREINLATSYRTDAFTAMTELEVLAPNHPRLLALFAGCCAAAGANIIGAQISTTRNGFAIDTFSLQRSFDDDADEDRRAGQIGRTIERVLKGEIRLREELLNKPPSERRIVAFDVVPEVTISNAISDRFTVIEVAGLDRPGLLYELTSTLSELRLDITSAHVTTFGEKAVDVFYVTDLTGRQVTTKTRQQAIRKRLLAVLAGAFDELSTNA